MINPLDPTLTVDLHHTFSSGFALDVSFRATTTSVALFGPSGSGKTTVLRAIAGLLSPQRGAVRFGGRVFVDRQLGIDLPPRERRVGLVVQDGLLFPRASVRENLLFGAPKSDARLSLEQVAELLEITPLLERMPRGLSGGERQRVALGRAVLSEPDLLLCDEPFAALDAPRRRRLVRVLARLRDTLKIPLLLVSHEVTEVLALCREAVILSEGKLRAHGPTVSLLRELADEDGSALNFWEGVLEGPAGEGSLQRVRVSDAHALLVPVADATPGQRVRLSVEPRHVSLSLAGGDSPAASPRNRIRGTVASLTPSAGLLRVTVDAGLEVAALITPDAAQELALAAGSEVIASFKAAAVDVLALGP